MLHAKFKDHRASGCGGEGLFTIYGHVGHLDHLDTNFFSPFQGMLHTKFDFDWPSGSEEKIFYNK